MNELFYGTFLNPFVIAEIGVNHEGDLKIAKRLIELAKKGGAHAAKFQTYKAEKLASKHSPAYWDTAKEPTQSQFELFRKYDRFGDKEYRGLAAHCRKVGIEFMSTPFDLDAVDLLDPLVKRFKIASADITNVPLLRKVARTGKPVILSTGASTLDEITQATEILTKAGATKISLLHCVLNYPTPPEKAQLGIIPLLKKEFPTFQIGYSDHVPPDAELSALEMASLLGAEVIEKHFTHDKTLPGNDHYHSMDYCDLRDFMAKLKLYRECFGQADKKDIEGESDARLHARRSITAKRSIGAGEVFSADNLIVKRPAHGISPLHWDEVVGARAASDIEEDIPLQWEMVEK